MPLLLLSALKYVLIALIWLFFLFAIRAVWRETRRQARTTVSTNLVAELVDAQDSGSCEGNLVGVQVPPRPRP